MTLLSVLRNGDNRFLPLLLAKVHDVLPSLANPMLQTVPDTPAASAMCEVDIFDGFGNAGMGVPSNFPGPNVHQEVHHEFKIEDQPNSFSLPNQNLASFDKRIEELSSPISCAPENGDNSPFATPTTILSSMEFPGIDDYGAFPGLSNPATGQHSNITPSDLGNFGEGVGGGGQRNFKRDVDGNLRIGGQGTGGLGFGNGNVGGQQMGNNTMVRRPPIRQGSSSFSTQIPRSLPEQFHHQQLQRLNSNGESHLQSIDIGMIGTPSDMSFR